ncbi:MAG: tetrahydrofolate dehydrogenase/cyclohydrolase catalytic domain-containing protein, partial [Betaproteobacteria bacterium]
MTAHLIDGNALAQQLRAHMATEVAALTAQGRRPGLTVLLVGEDPASQVYVRNKVKACESIGMASS